MMNNTLKMLKNIKNKIINYADYIRWKQINEYLIADEISFKDYIEITYRHDNYATMLIYFQNYYKVHIPNEIIGKIFEYVQE